MNITASSQVGYVETEAIAKKHLAGLCAARLLDTGQKIGPHVYQFYTKKLVTTEKQRIALPAQKSVEGGGDKGATALSFTQQEFGIVILNYEFTADNNRIHVGVLFHFSEMDKDYPSIHFE